MSNGAVTAIDNNFHFDVSNFPVPIPLFYGGYMEQFFFNNSIVFYDDHDRIRNVLDITSFNGIMQKQLLLWSVNCNNDQSWEISYLPLNLTDTSGKNFVFFKY